MEWSALIAGEADAAVTAAKAGGYAPLDFRRDSIAVVDKILVDLSAKASVGLFEQLAICAVLSSYVLEVAHREFGGVFQNYDDHTPMLMVGEPGFAIGIMVSDKVNGRANGELADSLEFLYAGLAEAVSSASSGEKKLFV
jgi:hypothetical protein